jgi:RNA polymerase sigma factor (sigma-70 family)
VSGGRVGDDRALVLACLEGDETAWSRLVDKYRGLIFSVPLRYHLARDDAAEVFHAVCVELFHELPRLRDADSLRPWLMTVAAHQSFRWKEAQPREGAREAEGIEAAGLPAILPAEIAAELAREQLVREAILRLPARCQEMMRLLFWEHPPSTYAEVSGRLGPATGKTGAVRGRCLERLQKALEELGF